MLVYWLLNESSPFSAPFPFFPFVHCFNTIRNSASFRAGDSLNSSRSQLFAENTHYFFFLKCCVTSTETIRTVRDGEPRTATSTFIQLLSSVRVGIQCCFTSTETLWTIRDGEPGTATSTFTQLSSSQDARLQMLLYVHREQKIESLATESPGRPPRLSHSS